MIKVYTSHSCFYCTRAKNYLDNLDIEYETLNIQEDSQARDFFIKSGSVSYTHLTLPTKRIV